MPGMLTGNLEGFCYAEEFNFAAIFNVGDGVDVVGLFVADVSYLKCKLSQV